MGDAERMARAWRSALRNVGFYVPPWEKIDTTRYITAAQSLLDAGYRLPQQETTVNETTHIGGWEKLTGNHLVRHGLYGGDKDEVEAEAINGCIELLTRIGFAPNGEPYGGPYAKDARERLAPLNITAETLRPKRKTVRVKCPNRLHTARCGDHRCCTICHGQLEYDAELVEDNDAGK